jgi:hypothetical protein
MGAYRGALELPAPIRKVCKVEKDSTGLVPKLGILYKNGGPVALCVKGLVAFTKDGIGPLLEVEAVETVVARTGNNGVGGGTPPVMKTMAKISGFPEEEIVFPSITIHFKGLLKGPLEFHRGWSRCDFW